MSRPIKRMAPIPSFTRLLWRKLGMFFGDAGGGGGDPAILNSEMEPIFAQSSIPSFQIRSEDVTSRL
jgi:hypothetical protein